MMIYFGLLVLLSTLGAIDAGFSTGQCDEAKRAKLDECFPRIELSQMDDKVRHILAMPCFTFEDNPGLDCATIDIERDSPACSRGSLDFKDQNGHCLPGFPIGFHFLSKDGMVEAVCDITNQTNCITWHDCNNIVLTHLCGEFGEPGKHFVALSVCDGHEVDPKDLEECMCKVEEIFGKEIGMRLLPASVH